MKTQTTTLAIVLALLALTTFAAPTQAITYPKYPNAPDNYLFALDREDTQSSAGSGGRCDPLNLVCAYARAKAHVYDCYDVDLGSGVFPCWYAYGGGSVSGRLGAVAGTLSGYANGVPLTDNCFAPAVGQLDGCVMNAYLDRYPGPAVQVTVTVTATAPYGTTDHTGFDFDSA